MQSEWVRLKAAARDDRGVALVTVLLALLILGGFAVTFTALALGETRQTGNSRDYESAVHAAEAGSDQVIARVNENPVYTTGHVYPNPPPADAAAERAWVEQQFQAARTAGTLSEVPGGQALGIRPVTSTGAPINVIFGVAEVAGAADPLRVVKLRFDSGFSSPQHAIITGGDLSINGSVDIVGDFGNVHSNGDLTITGAVNVSGDKTASGSGSAGVTAGVPPVPIPPVNARPLYERRFDYDGSGAATYDGSWFDLCYDATTGQATVRQPAAAGGGPCEGEELGGPAYAGLGFNAGARTWELKNNTREPVVYYVFEGSVSNAPKGPPNPGDDPCEVSNADLMTIITEATDAGEYGDVTISGNSKLQAYLQDLVILAEGDLSLSGTPVLQGLVATAAQVSIVGNTAICGAVIAENAIEVEDDNTISGNPTIKFNGGLTLPFAATIRITAWNEQSGT